jgi:hypothetical protein
VAVTLRGNKGSALTHAELDANFTDFMVLTGSGGSRTLSAIKAPAISSSEGYRFVMPEGAQYTTSNSTITGAIKIKLPVGRNNSSTMLRFTVKLYEYTTGYSTTWEIGGYNYSGENWYNWFATQLTDEGRSGFTVRWGRDATSDCIWIGETNSTWSYPQVFVTEVQTGYSGFDNQWGQGWAITFVTSFDTVEQSRTASNILCSNNATARVPSLGVGTAASGTSGEIRATNEITAYYSSDERLKENIKLIADPLGKLQQIRGVNFNWIDENIKSRGGEDGYFVRKDDVGVIAQEVEKVLPEVVATREDGYKAVRYEKMVPLLIEAIKEQQKQIKDLEKKILEITINK